jgi:serine/threonine protein kinase/tetratricopeptide (TPR) repeat protein
VDAAAPADRVGPVRTISLTLPSSENPGDRIGRYKLLQEIGAGGFGVVYMAEQEEPVRRRVALKIIKLGMDTKEVIARFEAERQALALMDHPHIAKVLDAGATESGRPYFVMELVKGERVTEYCDKHNLTTRQRLDLFVQICQAIQHAHQKGIIHRDIKPSNILVAMQDGVPVPKVIDFGIAKATEQRLTDKTFFTARGDFVGTPVYMSPEQAEMTGLDIDTRSDIYSLGVLLYELLTGKTPFDPKALLANGIEAMRRTIREDEPRRPSTRLTTMDAGELTTTAKRRQTDSPKLVHSVRGDLDWIVMKCLEKDRTRRYETASGLALDLQRHINNEPVLARPPSKVYRFQKMARRNKAAFAAATLIVVVLVAATGISVWQAIRATRAQTLANQRLAESEAISQFLTKVFQSPDPARDGRTITVAETLGAAARNLETALTNQPLRRAKLQATLGLTYHALGLFPEAISLEEKVRDYYLAVFGPENPVTLGAMHNLANSYYHAGRREEALKLREEVLAHYRKALGPEHPDSLGAMHNLATSYQDAGRRDEAVKLREQVLALRRKVSGPENPDTLDAMNNLALSYDAGRRDEALKLREELLPLRRKVNGPEHPDTLKAMHNLAISYDHAGRLDEAVKLREEVLMLRRKVLGPEHPDTLLATANLALSYDETGRRDEALKLREQVLALFRKVSGPGHPQTVRIMEDLAISYGSAGRRREALTVLAQACEIDPKNSNASLALATWQTWFSQDADYEATRRRLVQQAEGTAQADPAERAAEAACLRPSDDAALMANALNLAQRAVELGKSSLSLPWYQLSLGLAEYRNGQYAAAERSMAVAEQTAGDRERLLGIAHMFHAMTVFRQDRPDEARKLFSQAEAQMPSLPKDETKPIVDGRSLDDDLLVWWLSYKEAKSMLGESASVKH